MFLYIFFYFKQEYFFKEVKKNHSQQVKMHEESVENDIWTMQHQTVKKDCKRTLELYKLSEEYFPEQYVYEYNQDGKEHRYKGDHNIGRHRHDWY